MRAAPPLPPAARTARNPTNASPRSLSAPSGAASLLCATVLALGCASSGPVEAPAPAPAASAPAKVAATPSPRESERVSRAEVQVAELHAENERLSAALARSQARIAELEERHAALETELANAVEEVLRAKASMTGVQNRALAVSRISEVRVAVQALAGSADAEVSRRLDRATELLRRADAALEEENYGGAGFLAERASELVRQARTVAEIRTSAAGADVLPIVPPRDLEVTSTANLRAGPGLDEERVGSATTGDRLRALARAGHWYHVETEAGLRAWVHSSLVR